MAIPATRIGDADIPHCSGMTRAQGSFNTFVNGIPWSLMTHVNTPHLKPCGKECCIHSAPIAVGSDSVFVNGLGSGRIGDAIIGCTNVAEGSPNVYAGDSRSTPERMQTFHRLEAEQSEDYIENINYCIHFIYLDGSILTKFYRDIF